MCDQTGSTLLSFTWRVPLMLLELRILPESRKQLVQQIQQAFESLQELLARWAVETERGTVSALLVWES